MKPCKTCGVEKSLESFYRYHRNKDGRLNICKRCFLARRKVYEQRHSSENRWLYSASHSGLAANPGLRGSGSGGRQ